MYQKESRCACIRYPPVLKKKQHLGFTYLNSELLVKESGSLCTVTINPCFRKESVERTFQLLPSLELAVAWYHLLDPHEREYR